MANLNESYLISRNEDEYKISTEDAHIMSRYSASTAAANTDENKIYDLTGNIKFIIKNSLSPNEDGVFYKTYLETSMLQMPGMAGNEVYKNQCPFMSIAFANSFRKMCISRTT